MKLRDKVIVITGASKGLGKALAAAFVKEKANVVIAARLKKEIQLASKETGAIPFVADVTRESDMQKLAAFAKKKFGRLDLWVNNAGVVLPHTDIEQVDVAGAHRLMEVNFFGTFYGSREAMKIMKRQKQGTIMNIVSSSSLIGRPQSSAYAASKWAARGFTESLRLALKSFRNISVIAVHPEGFKTTIFGSYKPVGYDTWMETSYVAHKIIQNLKRAKPKESIIISR